MADPLPNRNEELPDERRYDPSQDDSWADILRNVLEELSVNAIVSGTDRTNFEPKDGQLFVPMDGGSWYIGDGNGWNNISAESLTEGGTIDGNLAINGDLDVNSSSTTGIEITHAEGHGLALGTYDSDIADNNRAELVPVDQGTSQTANDIRYFYNSQQWVVKSDLRVEGVLSFEALSSDPSDPPNGSMWFVE